MQSPRPCTSLVAALVGVMALPRYCCTDGDRGDEVCAAGMTGGACGDRGDNKGPRWRPKTLSVVLPCANEGDFALKTVRAVADSVPGGAGGKILSEVIVVDDGSVPPVSTAFPQELLDNPAVRLLRHASSKGLIRSKSAGAQLATGDVIVFFDCHVAPQPGWHKEFFDAMRPNYRRIVVPSITDLDIDTWKQRRHFAPVNKCYLTFDADFKWYQSGGTEIPILSGGLLGISARWWRESGGYDDAMRTWGGENIDQSLRTWLCGGEIFALPGAQVAHMWRSGEDPRTLAKYDSNPAHSLENRARAAAGWFGNFSAKLSEYAHMTFTRWDKIDVTHLDAVRKRLSCRPFAWFLWRFREIYEDAGLVPDVTFRLQHRTSGLCLTYLGPSGTHPKGTEMVSLVKCGVPPPLDRWPSRATDPQRWHLANRKTDTGRCCSGFRVWNTDQCLQAGYNEARTVICELGGRIDQSLRFTDESDSAFAFGQIIHAAGKCLRKHKGSAQPIFEKCKVRKNKPQEPMWRKINIEVPLEARLYALAKAASPQLFV